MSESTLIKANDATAPKVFKLSSLTLPAGEMATLNASVAFRQMTTRKHYPGVHRVEAVINGRLTALGEFLLAAN